MKRKTSLLLLFFVFAATTNAAYSAADYATVDYVDDQVFDIYDYFEAKDTNVRNTLAADSKQLYKNQEVLRDMLNRRDENGEWLTLDTEEQLAIPAINELHAEMAGKQDAITAENLLPAENVSGLAAVATSGSYNDLTDKPTFPDVADLVTSQQLIDLQTALEDAIDEKQAKGDYALASELTAVNTAIGELQSGKADASAVTALQETISKLGDTYASKSEMTAADEALQNAITEVDNAVKAIDLSQYATKASLSDYALASDLANKADVDAVGALQESVTNIENTYLTQEKAADTYATTEQITNIENTYLTQEKAADTYLTETQVVEQITNVVGSDTDGLIKQVADNTAAIADKANTADVAEMYATKAELGAKQDELTAGSNINIVDNVISASIDLSGYATTEQLSAKVDAAALDGLVTSQELQELLASIREEINAKQAAGDYASSEALTTVSNSLSLLKADTYTKSEVDQIVADAVSGGQIDLSGYAKQVDLDTLSGVVSAIESKTNNLKALAYKDTVSTADIDNDAVTTEKIAPGTPNDGERMLMAVGDDGKTTWLSVKIY